MEYRNFGNTGLKVSALSFGSWLTFNESEYDNRKSCIKEALDNGINFLDCAEGYGLGKAEEVIGRVIKDLGLNRNSYILSTKYFFGGEDRSLNMSETLNRKYLMQAIDGSLLRFGIDFIDVIYCHRPDQNTPIEETTRAMNDIICSGKALYWGTSEWSADEIRTAYNIADKYGWHKPVIEQPEYNILKTERVEEEYKLLYRDINLGLTTFSPLCMGILTGKYINGVPEGNSRASMGGWIKDSLLNEEKNEKVKKIKHIADELNLSLAELAIGWCLTNKNVSSVITGSSSVKQLKQNLKVIDSYKLITEEIKEKISQAIK